MALHDAYLNWLGPLVDVVDNMVEAFTVHAKLYVYCAKGCYSIHQQI